MVRQTPGAYSRRKPKKSSTIPASTSSLKSLGFQHAAQLPQFRDYYPARFREREIRRDVRQGGAGPIRQRVMGGGKKAAASNCASKPASAAAFRSIRSLSESFAVEEPEAIFGIVNGTCNYILSQMEKSGKPYAEALKEAQQKGYAETNPAADVNGSDAEAKLLLAESGRLWPADPTGHDLAQRDRRYPCGGFSLCRAAPARARSNNSPWPNGPGQAVQVFVSPALVARDNFLASIDGATNAICFAGKKSGGARGERDCDYVLVGPGAGGGPTAVAVLGDVCELARGDGQFTGLPSLIARQAR